MAETPEKRADEAVKSYELSFVLNSAETFEALIDALRKHGCLVKYQSQVSQVRLMYPIKKNDTGFFGFVIFEALPEYIVQLRNALGLIPSVLRFLIITPPVKTSAKEPVKPAPRAEAGKPAAPAAPVLTNEALEQKLEEILK